MVAHRARARTRKAAPKSGFCGAVSTPRGAEGTRTPDPLHAMQVRYQLRHSPKILRSGAPKSE